MGTKFFIATAAAVLISIATAPGAFAQDGTDASMQGAAPPPAHSQPQVVQPDQGGVNWQGVGVGAGTVASNVVYVPAKLLYGILGGIAGGAGYVLTGGNQQVSDTIWRSSLGGDYVVTPDMLTGKEAVHFSGPTETAPATSADAGNAAASSPSLTAASIPPANASAVHPMDSGAGRIRQEKTAAIVDGSGSGAITVGAGDSAVMASPPPAEKGTPLPPTNIE